MGNEQENGRNPISTWNENVTKIVGIHWNRKWWEGENSRDVNNLRVGGAHESTVSLIRRPTSPEILSIIVFCDVKISFFFHFRRCTRWESIQHLQLNVSANAAMTKSEPANAATRYRARRVGKRIRRTDPPGGNTGTTMGNTTTSTRK